MNAPSRKLSCPKSSGQLAICVAAFSLFLGAALAQERDSSAELLAGWQSRGGTPTTGVDPAITVPQGAEILQLIAAHAVTVQMVTRPYFSATPSGGPFLEVGSVALTFIRDAGGGAMLMFGDQPLRLPFAIELAGDGRSRQSLQFALRYDRASETATLLIDGNSYGLQASASGESIEVVLSAGAEAAWTISSVTVTPEVGPAENEGARERAGPGAVPGGGSGGGFTKVADRAKFLAERKAATDEALGYFRDGDYARGEEVLLRTNRHPKGSLGWFVESAGRLSQMALMLRQIYDHKGAIILGKRAVELLLESRSVATEATTRNRVAAHEVAGFVQEELLRDLAAARAEFEEARRLDPQSARARRSLEKLDESGAKSQRLTGGR